MTVPNTFGLGEEERDDQEVDEVQADEYEIILPADVGNSSVGYLGKQYVERPVRTLSLNVLADTLEQTIGHLQ